VQNAIYLLVQVDLTQQKPCNIYALKKNTDIYIYIYRSKYTSRTLVPLYNSTRSGTHPGIENTLVQNFTPRARASSNLQICIIRHSFSRLIQTTNSTLVITIECQLVLNIER